MPELAKVRVHYPVEDGRLVLRTDADWGRDLEPVSATADRTQFDFEFDLDRRFTYYKPVIRRNGGEFWSQGDNHLFVGARGRVQNVFPYFFDDPVCSPCTLREIPSKITSRDHAVRVFYPPGYAENTMESYPVLYMHDGQNLFFPTEAFSGHHWKVEETLKILTAMNLIKKAIVVGIYPGNRMEEYTSPGYEPYGKFIVEELKPWVDSNYRTLRGSAHTATMGSSLGGVVSLYLAWQWPEVFGKAACLSSTFGWKDDLFERVAQERKRSIQVYLDSGWPRDNYETTRSMRAALRQRGYQEGRDLMYLAFPGARHNEEDWAMRAHLPLQFFFGRLDS